MKEVLEKLTSYNLFNYLLPGVMFAVLASTFTHFSFVQQDLIVGAFVYYFIGLVISRVGSLILEPLLKSISFVRFADYKDFVAASKADSQIEVLSEANNSYRTLCAMFLLLLFLKLYDRIQSMFPVMTAHGMTVGLVLLMVMFLFAYRKQTSYISKRVRNALSEPGRPKARGTTA